MKRSTVKQTHKRVLAWILCCLMIIGLTACTQSGNGTSSTEPASADSSATAPDPATLPAGTENPSDETLTFEQTIDWDAEYDVVVVGFGGAGAVTSMTAADAGASVLLLEKAPYGEAGGNTRYAAQIILHIPEDLRSDAITYMKGLRGLYNAPSDEKIETYVDMVIDNQNWLRANGCEPIILENPSPEYPHLPGAASMQVMLTAPGSFNGAFWNFLYEQVTKRSDSIDVWYEAPGTHLIQDPETRIIHGVIVEVDGKEIYVRAKNGVVLCTGGFENNMDMIQNYLSMPYAYSKGARYNTGDGILMAQEVGARLVNMSVISGPDVNVYNPATGNAFGYQIAGTASFAGSGLGSKTCIFVGSDGTRFVNEATATRHGHINNHGSWVSLAVPTPSFAVFDEATMLSAPIYSFWSENNQEELEKGWIKKADTVKELAELLGINPESLAKQINEYNEYCKEGYDPCFHRPAETLTPFGDGPFYAVELVPSFTNTQGGPERNERGEVLDVNGNVIPHLYSAGELGSIFGVLYQGAGNLAENIAFGRISGANASAEKTDTYRGSVMDGKTAVDFTVSESAFTVGENEYLGVGTGMGGQITVKVTMDGDTITAIEVLEHFDTAGICEKAIDALPALIIEANSTEVDVISGATMTSRGILEAVNDALSKR